jgi:hypothetical protein
MQRQYFLQLLHEDGVNNQGAIIKQEGLSLNEFKEITVKFCNSSLSE